MDPLDRLAGPAEDLLTLVDEVLLVAGAPAGHRIWPLLRRLGVLPGDTLAAIVALRAAPVQAAAKGVRTRSGGYDEAQAALGGVAWEGAGAQAYDHLRDALRAHVAGGPDSLTGRLDATASYLEAIAAWIGGSRLALARTLAEVVTSAQAVTVVTGGIVGPAPAAAADIGARVLAVGAEVAERGDELLQRYDPQLTRIAFRAPAGVGGRLDGITRIGG